MGENTLVERRFFQCSPELFSIPPSPHHFPSAASNLELSTEGLFVPVRYGILICCYEVSS
jgi:hypothetical protein